MDLQRQHSTGIRLGEQVEKDMIAVRIGPETCMAAVAAPSYWEAHPKPKVPQDLTHHNCINIRFQTAGGLYAWEFEKNGRSLNVRVNGQIICNGTSAIISAALLGLADPLQLAGSALSTGSPNFNFAVFLLSRARASQNALCGHPARLRTSLRFRSRPT